MSDAGASAPAIPGVADLVEIGRTAAQLLLERLVGATLNGSVTLDFRPEGLVCEIEFPDEGLAGT